MYLILAVLWFVSFVIVMGYYLIIFTGRQHKRESRDTKSLPGVSIVIAVKNNSDRLISHLDAIRQQDYPAFEIIIVNDHSDDVEKEKLERKLNSEKKIFLFHNQGKAGKKQALHLGIQHANYPIILCTDADCQPVSNEWIKGMVASGDDKAMVLGYSPYATNHDLLNFFLRYETVMTAMQYFSWALRGRPYMGVGRNILFPRDLFLEVNPYKDHLHIPYGDDDLWVQQAASKTDIKVNLDKNAFVISDPVRTWKAWWKQKHRHLSAGHHYSQKHWWQPGLLGMAMVMHWLLIALMINHPNMYWVFVFFKAGIIVRWGIYFYWAKKLEEKDTIFLYPLLEVGYALYLAIMGLFTFFVKKKAWN